jgi:hypothetical protein
LGSRALSLVRTENINPRGDADMQCYARNQPTGAALSLSFGQIRRLSRSQLSRKGCLGFRVNVVMDCCPKIEYQRLAT